MSNKIDKVRSELSSKIDEVRSELSSKIDRVHNDLIIRNDNTNARIDKLAYNMVRQTEYNKLEIKIEKLQAELSELKAKVA